MHQRIIHGHTEIWDFSMSVQLDMSLSHKHPWPCIIFYSWINATLAFTDRESQLNLRKNESTICEKSKLNSVMIRALNV